MRSFGTEISGNRMRGGELTEAQRIYCLAQVEAGAKTAEIANVLGCSQRCVQKTIQRWITTSSTTTQPRMGWPPILTSRDHRRLLWIAHQKPSIKYHKLMEEAGLWAPDQAYPDVSTRTVQRAMAQEGYRNF